MRQHEQHQDPETGEAKLTQFSSMLLFTPVLFLKSSTKKAYCEISRKSLSHIKKVFIAIKMICI